MGRFISDDDEYEEYMNRKLFESVQYKTHYETVEELTMSKYYNYEVEEEKPKEKTDWSEVVLVILIYAAIIGGIVFVFWRLK